MEKLTVFLWVLLYTFQNISSSEVPVLLWTNKGEVQYPVTLSGHTLGQSDFTNGYLDQIFEDEDQNIAIYLQDKLSLEDITQYGDVYNDRADEAVLSSIRGVFETYESTHLPSVKAPADAIQLLQKKFKGTVHILNADDKVEDVTLQKDRSNLIVVNLPKTVGFNKRDALKHSDGIIGKVTKLLADENRPFSAVYTGHEVSASPAQEEVNFRGRHLLADPSGKAGNETEIYSLFNISGCVLLYFKRMTLSLPLVNGKPPSAGENATFMFPVLKQETDEVIERHVCNKTANYGEFTLNFKDHLLPENMSMFTMNMLLNVSRGYWMISKWQVSYALHLPDKKDTINGTDVGLDLHQDVIYGTMPYGSKDNKSSSSGYSYYCGNQPPIRQYERNLEDKKNLNQVQLTFQDLQLQYMPTNHTFGPPNHCVTVFTGAIWSSIVVMILMTMILAFGLIMIMNITTMDRFDDPKGKTIQVNVSE